MALHTVGPESMREDELRIGSQYKMWFGYLLSAVPLVAANYLDLKWVVAIGFSVMLCQLHEAGGRLHDLCIRHRRTNILLADRNSN
jgi:hypothetical protein